MTPALDIRGSGTAFTIRLQGRELARASSHGNALARLAGLERQLTTRTRPCLCCAQPFASQGKGNRLCPGCRKGGLE